MLIFYAVLKLDTLRPSKGLGVLGQDSKTPCGVELLV